jgi:DNA polymerase elongation subunit (family B)
MDDYVPGIGCKFKRDPIGILPTVVLELDELRNDYKAKRKEALDKHGKESTEYRKWNTAQLTVKRMRASIYGATGNPNFGWYDRAIAENITGAGREALMLIVEKAEEWGYQVIYGDTDSIFVKVGDELSPEEAGEASTELGRKLTEYMRTRDDIYARTDAIDVEAEAVMDKIMISAKKRYGGRIVWLPDTGTDIMDLPIEARLKVTGLKMKASKTAPVGKAIEKQSLIELFDGKSIDEITGTVKSYIERIKTDFSNGIINIEEICGRARLRKSVPPLHLVNQIAPKIAKKNSHYSLGSSTINVPNPDYLTQMSNFHKAAAWHNIVLDNDEYGPLEQGDSYFTTFVSDGPTWIPNGGMVAFHDIEQISQYTIDIDKIIEKNIVDSMDSIISAMNGDKELLTPKKVRFMVADYIE